MFERAEANWPAHAWRAILDAQGKSIFINHAKLATCSKEKFSSPLYGAVVRLAAKSQDFERTCDILREMAFALRIVGSEEGNSLIPLQNGIYPFEDHEADLVLRQSRRSGMLLNAEELIDFVHFPGSEVRSSKLVRAVERTKAAPESVRGEGLFLGQNRHMGVATPVALSTEARLQHVHVIGVSGMGKSTLLYRMILADIAAGETVAVLDPHAGDLIDRILESIPAGRVNDVILVDPSDEEYSVGFNILSAHSDLEKNILASDLVSVFRRLSTSWGDQMGSVLRNAILAFLESDQGGTLADLAQFLIEPAYRERFLKTVRGSGIAYYWKKRSLLC